MNTDAVSELLASLARAVPSLPRAACRGRTELFDREDADGRAQAAACCAVCPERGPCAAWAASQNPYTLTGVIAGHRYRPDHKKKGAS